MRRGDVVRDCARLVSGLRRYVLLDFADFSPQSLYLVVILVLFIMLEHNKVGSIICLLYKECKT